MTPLHRLAARMGIHDRFHRIDGVEVVTPDATRLALLRAMGHPLRDAADAADALAAVEAADAARRMPREGVVTADRPQVWRGPHDRAWRLTLEDGGTVDGPPNADLPPLPPGLHVLEAEGEETLLIAAPDRAPDVPALTGRARVWGMTAALYGLVSARSLGRGDYADLAAAAEGLARLGADFLGINPVHDRGPAPGDLSPYSPSSRTGFDVTHIAPDQVPEYPDCPEAQALLEAAAPAGLAAASAEFGDADLRARVLTPALDALFARFEAASDPAPLDAWLAQGGRARARQALFAALSLRHGPDWRHWPAPLQDAGSPETAAFAAAHARETRRAAWALWTADRQLARAQARARAAGMGLGLYLDLAVGVRPGGAETWADRAEGRPAFAAGVSLGAPPDALAAGGQVWNLAPFDPHGLAARRYAPFRAMLRAAATHAGLVRIDHVIGLERAFWTPEDGAPGTYVSQPSEALFALVRLEAARAGCAVVGEDLGTVPEGFRERLAAQGLHGCAVLQFEGGPEGFARPADWPEHLLAAFATHDTPTLAGWWRARDVDDRQALGQLTPAQAGSARTRRAAERAALARRLADDGLAPADLDPAAPPPTLPPSIRDAVHGLLAGSGAALAAVQLDDALGAEAAQNLPGTVTEAPNWRRRHAADPAAPDRNPDLRCTAQVMSAARGRPPQDADPGPDPGPDTDAGPDTDPARQAAPVRRPTLRSRRGAP